MNHSIYKLYKPRSPLVRRGRPLSRSPPRHRPRSLDRYRQVDPSYAIGFFLIESVYVFVSFFFIIYHVYIYLYSLYPRSPPRQGKSRDQYICILGPLLDKEYHVTSIFALPVSQVPSQTRNITCQYICILGPLLDEEYRVTSIYLHSLYPRSPPRQGISREYICTPRILGPLLDEEYHVTSIFVLPVSQVPFLDKEYHMTSIFVLPYPRSPPRQRISHDQYICTPCIQGSSQTRNIT